MDIEMKRTKLSSSRLLSCGQGDRNLKTPKGLNVSLMVIKISARWNYQRFIGSDELLTRESSEQLC